MDVTSLTPEQGKLNAQNQILPEVFSDGIIDQTENIFIEDEMLEELKVLQMKDAGIEYKTR